MRQESNLQEEMTKLFEKAYKQHLGEAIKRGIAQAKLRKEAKTK